MRGIWPDKVVQSAAGLHAGRVGPAFAAIVRSLAREGAQAVTTTCGFLVLLQKELQAAAKVPVITSSLMLLPKLLAAQPRVGVLTISATKLGKEHLRAAGVPRERLGDVVVQGVDPKGEFATRILGNQPELDEFAEGHVASALSVPLSRFRASALPVDGALPFHSKGILSSSRPPTSRAASTTRV